MCWVYTFSTPCDKSHSYNSRVAYLQPLQRALAFGEETFIRKQIVLPDIRSGKVEHDIDQSRLIRRDSALYESINDLADLVSWRFLVSQSVENGQS